MFNSLKAEKNQDAAVDMIKKIIDEFGDIYFMSIDVFRNGRISIFIGSTKKGSLEEDSNETEYNGQKE